MIPILYSAMTEGIVPTNYGIGPLTDCLKCTVTEERNGSYELALEYPANGIHAEEITPNRFIMAKPNYTDDPQIFRIYKVGKAMGGKFTVNAQHISYDLGGKIINGGTAGTCAAAIALLQTAAGNFTLTTDKGNIAPFNITAPSSVRSWFGGKAGSLLQCYGGEWKYNNYTAALLLNRGADRGVTIRYGKNLTQLSQTLDMSNLCTGIIPYYIDTNGNKTIGSRFGTGLVLDVPRDKAIDFSSDVDPESNVPITSQLTALTAKYIGSNNLKNITNSITLDFVQMKDLTERVDLCDTVHIYFEALGITATAKCVKTVWDVLEDRYTKTTFGDARVNIADTIATNKQEIAASANISDVNKATELITGNLGGYVIMHDSDGDGKPDEILVMDTANISTATKVWRWNKSGLGYSSTGYAGPYGLAMTSNGQIVADYVSTGVLSANIIKAGVLTDEQGNSSIDMTDGVATMRNFDAKERFRLLSSSGVAKVSILHNANSGTNMTFVGENGLEQIYIHSSTDYGGLVSLNNKNGKTIAYLGPTVGLGGFLTLNDTNETQNIQAVGQSGNITCVSVTQTSSRKVKENIKPIEDAEKILQLDAVSFDYKNKELGTNKRGFIAEDVEKVLPNLVTPEKDGRPATLDYLSMIPYLQDVIKKQDERIKALEEKIKTMEG